MDTQEAKKQLEGTEKRLQDAIKQLGDTKADLLIRMVPVEQKNLEIDGEPARAGITPSGTIMLQFVSFEEAKKYFDKL